MPEIKHLYLNQQMGLFFTSTICHSGALIDPYYIKSFTSIVLCSNNILVVTEIRLHVATKQAF